MDKPNLSVPSRPLSLGGPGCFSNIRLTHGGPPITAMTFPDPVSPPSVRPSGRIVNVLAIQGDHFQSRRPTMIPVFGRVISIESPKPWPESDVAFEHSSTASDNLERHVLALHVLQNSFWDTWKSRTPPFFPGAPFPSAFRFFATFLGVSLWGFPFPFFREHSLRECPAPEQ